MNIELRQEERHSEPASPHNVPTEVLAFRASPSEIAQAVTEIEARRPDESSSTIAVADAIQQLGFEVTADELVNEIVQTRNRLAARHRRHTLLHRTLASIVLGMVAVVVYMAATTYRGRLSPRPVLPADVLAADSVRVERLSQIPDGLPVCVDNHNLGKLTDPTVDFGAVYVSRPLADSSSAHSTMPIRNQWTIVKSGRVVRFRGWTTRVLSMQLKDTGVGEVYSAVPAWTSAADAVQVEFPVFRLDDWTLAGLERNGSLTNVPSPDIQRGVVESEAESVRQFIQKYVTGYQDRDGAWAAQKVWIVVVNRTVRITGSVGSPTHVQGIQRLVKQAVDKLPVPLTIENHLTVGE